MHLTDEAERDELRAKVEELELNLEWQIRQNVKMFKALEKISKAGTREYTWSSLQQIAKEGMVEA